MKKIIRGKLNNSNKWGFSIIAGLLLCVVMLCTGAAFGETSENGTLYIDPDSISGENEKEGNILAEYGFSVFTEESMAEIQAAKDKEEKNRQEMLDRLFSDGWNETEDYDSYVNEVIEAGNLFSNVNTGVEIVSEEDNVYGSISKWIRIGMTGILMCLISITIIIYRRKRYEHKNNN